MEAIISEADVGLDASCCRRAGKIWCGLRLVVNRLITDLSQDPFHTPSSLHTRAKSERV